MAQTTMMVKHFQGDAHAVAMGFFFDSVGKPGGMKRLSEDPGDTLTLSIFRDWLEDAKLFTDMQAVEFLLAHKKRPYKGGEKWHWFNDDQKPSGLGDPESDIPIAIYQLMDSGEVKANHREWGSAWDAMMAFFDAFSKAVTNKDEKARFDPSAWKAKQEKAKTKKSK